MRIKNRREAETTYHPGILMVGLVATNGLAQQGTLVPGQQGIERGDYPATPW